MWPKKRGSAVIVRYRSRCSRTVTQSPAATPPPVGQRIGGTGRQQVVSAVFSPHRSHHAKALLRALLHFKRLRMRNPDPLPVRVRQHEVIHELVRPALPLDRQPGSRPCGKYSSLPPTRMARQRRASLCSVANWCGREHHGTSGCRRGPGIQGCGRQIGGGPREQPEEDSGYGSLPAAESERTCRPCRSRGNGAHR